MLEGISFAMILSKLSKLNENEYSVQQTEYTKVMRSTWSVLQYQQWRRLLWQQLPHLLMKQYGAQI
jgi:bisphosphoglycerate-dependent phosphoglycerate mutase